MNKYKLKSFLMKTWLFGECKKVAKTLALHDVDLFKKNKLSKEFGTAESYVNLVDTYCNLDEYPLEYCFDLDNKYLKKYPHLWKECKKLCNSFINRRKRLVNRISKMLINNNGELHSNLFLTLTFRDSFIQSTTEKNRREYISRYLRSFGVPYVANIDFGDNHEYIDRQGNTRTATAREHYHAIIQIDRIDFDSYKYGHIFVERIYVSEKSKKSLATYVAKLTNHAIKESTKRCSLLYSKKFKLD